MRPPMNKRLSLEYAPTIQTPEIGWKKFEKKVLLLKIYIIKIKTHSIVVLLWFVR